ncbi:purine-nucleoside phosphorylase [bacterium]|nr:purine-nucleoside phosphorylase [bacterium]PIV82210.1 MAG: purine-nucleoside phosphorylase [bacterium CG17_big_fil_post_rev_8_21_14_2_50_64_8]PJA77194.1 MAG: purine-nucleoside phosphorylase [bacterium CG_4_9_14_3_um_filter_65_15]
MSDLWTRIREAADFIRSRYAFEREVGLILGTGLGDLGSKIEDPCIISYGDVPHFVEATATSHDGVLVCGTLGGRRVMAMQGRVHYYEGYTMQEITLPVRVMKALGANVLLMSNAVGGMNPQLGPGDITVITDHINLMGDNPLIGPNDDRLGPRFPDMSEPYDREFVATMERVALERKIPLKRAVYAAVAGPNLESGAEYRFLRAIGADTVGMSSVPECLVAVHGGMRVVGLQVVTDACFPDNLKPAVVEEIIKVANNAQPKLEALVTGFLEQYGP